MPLLAQRITVTPPGPGVDIYRDTRALQLELLDGTVVIPFDTPDQFVMPGLTGAGLAPRNVVTDTTPGIDGGWLREISIKERPIFLPFFIGPMAGHTAYLNMLADLRRVVSLNGHTASDLTESNGHFNLVAQSTLGERVLTVAYTDGLEGDESSGAAGSYWATLGVNLVAVDPYWRDRGTLIQTYLLASSGVFIGDGDDSTPWPRKLSATVIAGAPMDIVIDSDVPTYPEIRVIGPATAMTYSASTGGAITYTGSIPGGQELVITTGRVKSAKLNGTSVWGNLAQGSSMPPLQPGSNVVNVTVTGASGASQIQVLYRKGWESAW